MMTIGHSTLPIESFLRALKESDCTLLVDVRRHPGSRRHPQYSQQQLFAFLEEAGIHAVWREGLGGRRLAQKDSINMGWQNESFRGYADYMQTLEFRDHLDWLMDQREFNSSVIMCAEAVPWRCHRSLIADAVLARGGSVEDIFVLADGRSSRKPHKLTSFAQVSEGRLFYPPPQPDLFCIDSTRS
jgi:uncharacterized protein (DUF488 family)